MKKQEEKLIGQIFNKGVVIKFLGREKRRDRKGLLWLLRCECGNEYSATTTQLICCIKKSCGCLTKEIRNKPKINDLGKRYGKLIVINIGEEKTKSGKIYRKCICDCGNYKYVTISYLRSGKVTSCGCDKRRQGKHHPLYKGYEDISMRYWNRVKNNAKKRNIEFSIDIEYAWEIWIRQNKKCALSGLNLFFERSKSSGFTASLDRIDNSKGYVKNNIQWIHKDINKIKSDFNLDRFIEICKLVTDFKKE